MHWTYYRTKRKFLTTKNVAFHKGGFHLLECEAESVYVEKGLTDHLLVTCPKWHMKILTN